MPRITTSHLRAAEHLPLRLPIVAFKSTATQKPGTRTSSASRTKLTTSSSLTSHRHTCLAETAFRYRTPVRSRPRPSLMTSRRSGSTIRLKSKSRSSRQKTPCQIRSFVMAVLAPRRSLISTTKSLTRNASNLNLLPSLVQSECYSRHTAEFSGSLVRSSPAHLVVQLVGIWCARRSGHGAFACTPYGVGLVYLYAPPRYQPSAATLLARLPSRGGPRTARTRYAGRKAATSISQLKRRTVFAWNAPRRIADRVKTC